MKEYKFVIDSQGRKRKAKLLHCAWCEEPFYKPLHLLNPRTKFCSRKCMGLASRSRVTIRCDYCKKEFDRTPSEVGKGKHGYNFCSRACKDNAQRIGGIEDIQPNHYGDLALLTKSECLDKYGYLRGKSRLNADARRIYERDNRPKICHVCGYDIYIEVCHIKPVSEFCDTALLSEINDPKNLISLCPNHHKEYDLGLIQLGR